jgi:hypothetical protein
MVPYEYIRELLGFQKGAPEQVYVHGGALEGFWSVIAGGANQQRNSIRTPSSKYVTLLCKWIFGENERDKDNQHGVELALLGWFGVLPLHVAYLFATGYYKEPKHLLPGTSLGFEYMKKGKYINEDERGGFKVAKVNLPLLEGRLRLFLEGKKDWLKEGLLVPAKKNKREGL